MAYLFLLLVPIFVSLGFKLAGGRKITLKEFGVMLAINLVVGALLGAMLYYSATADVEAWNGRVKGKDKVWTSCEHSYSCNCRESCSGSGSDRSCTTICETCYEHSNDWDWDVYTTLGETITIDRVDRRGSDEPPRWTAVRIGEPTTTTHWYQNYVKAAPDSLFRPSGDFEGYKNIPKYPKRYDYYRMDRFLPMGVTVPDAKAWNDGLAEINATLGPAKQANVVMVVGLNQPREWYYAVERNWLGGKKNDIVVVVSLDSEGKIQWNQVMAWTSNEMFKVVLRDEINAIGTLDRERIIPALTAQVKALYVRRPMSEFEYLRASIVPTAGQLVFTGIVALIISICAGLVMLNKDLFDEEWRNEGSTFGYSRGYGHRRGRYRA